MAAASGYGCHAAAQPKDVHWGRPTRGRPISKLARTVLTPAPYPAARCNRTRVNAPRSHRSYAAGQPNHVHRRSACKSDRVTQCSGSVPAPTPEAACLRQGATMEFTRGDRCWTAQTQDVDGDSAIGRRSVTKLAKTIVAPALHVGCGHQGASMQSSPSDSRNATCQPRNVGRRYADAHTPALDAVCYR